jgi:hypothetical protein
VGIFIYLMDLANLKYLRSKYPISIVKCLLEDVSEKVSCIYDISCEFQKTLANSSIGPEANEKKFSLMVGAFHSHAHNQGCQLSWHPLYIQGTGKSKGEGCEHIFSASHDIAQTTCYVSCFHRHQAIEEFFTFWDEEKYAYFVRNMLYHLTGGAKCQMLAKFICNHYCNAAEDIHLLEQELEVACAVLKQSPNDFSQHIEDEKAYLESLRKPPPDIEVKGRYMEALNELHKQRYVNLGTT